MNGLETQTKALMTSVIHSDTLYVAWNPVTSLQIYSRILYLRILNKNGNVYVTVDF